MYPVHTNTGFSAGAPLYLRKISSRADELVLTSGAKDYEGSLEFNLRWNVYLIRVSFAYSTLSGLRYICGSDIFESNRLGRNDHVFSCGRNYFRERKNDGTKERFVGVSFTASNVFSSIRWLMGMRETIDLLLSSVSIDMRMLRDSLHVIKIEEEKEFRSLWLSPSIFWITVKLLKFFFSFF